MTSDTPSHDPRTLRSKRARHAVFAAADGRCQSCGAELSEGWHVDHVVPWSADNTTRLHNLRALCPPCNLKKGASMKTHRKHALQLVKRANDIAVGRVTASTTVAAVTPGGGKSLAAAAFARVLLDAGFLDFVVWVCPRASLAVQAADSFCDRDFNPQYKARRADNTDPLIRDESLGVRCYTTTYQGIAACPDLHRDEVRRRRYLVILDEPHHLADEEGRSWVSAIAPLVAHATHTLLMTGTIERHDGARIPFIDYAEQDDGSLLPRTDVEYTRRDALGERAILPIEFTYVDGWVRYLDGATEKSVDISKATEDELSRVIATFLGQRSYREALLRRGLDAWLAYRGSGHRSRAIVVCAHQAMAKDVADFVRDQYGVQVALATSDIADAQHTLRQFRYGERGDVLVTVGMAYEGLDVPDCSHLVCLTNTRSVPWLEQAFARVTRVDYKAARAGFPYERQHAFIYVPDDPRMHAVVERLRAEQAQGIQLREERVDGGGVTSEKTGRIFVGLDAKDGAVSFGTIDGRLVDDDAQLVHRMREAAPALAGLSTADLLRVANAVTSSRPQTGDEPEPVDAYRTDEETRLRTAIQGLTNSRDRQRKLDHGSTNKAIWRHFRKSREQMGVVELREVLRFIERMDVAS